MNEINVNKKFQSKSIFFTFLDNNAQQFSVCFVYCIKMKCIGKR
jgi:hypothetical protein